MNTTAAIRCLAWELANTSPGTPHQAVVGSALAKAIRSQGQTPSPAAVAEAIAMWSAEPTWSTDPFDQERDAHADRVAELEAMMHGAPRDPGPIAPGLRGWTMGVTSVCARCAGRIMARGFANEFRGWRAVFEPDPRPGCSLPSCTEIPR